MGEWHIHTIDRMYCPDAQSGVVDGGRTFWFRSVAEPYPCTFWERCKAAWAVLKGDAHAMIWPEPGDLERATGEVQVWAAANGHTLPDERTESDG